MEYILAGKLQYLKMVKGESDSTYIALQNRFDALVNTLKTDSLDSNQFTYLSTMNVKQFEEFLQTKIEKGVSKNDKVYHYFVTDGKKKAVHASASVKGCEDFSNLYISQCESKTDGKRFYLLHKPLVQVLPCKIDDSNGKAMDNMLSELVESNFDLEKLLAYGTE